MARDTAAMLEDLLIHGAIPADEVGLGKIKQSLLAVRLHAILTDTNRPTLICVPAGLVNSWIAEIREEWP